MTQRSTSRYARLSRAELATLVPELLLIGQLIDRSGMAWCISAFGRQEMAQIAIEEWAGSSPIYTRRMQKALRYEGTDVITVFKGLQLDIGAPPQFMDFRYDVQDRWHGTFHLDHCGALMDVEPMGEDYVRSMCHDIEDPTFDATAVATNPKAQVRPVHRPPRRPADIEGGSRPHCAWTVVIDESHPPVTPLAPYYVVEKTRAATVELAPIDASEDGLSDYSGPLVSDVDFGAFSHSALVRIADEVCLQMHLLNLSFVHAVRQRADGEVQTMEVATKQLIGIAGIAAERIHRALGHPQSPEGALRTLELHPLLNPAAYVAASVDGLVLDVERSDATDDGAWIALCGPDQPAPLQAAVRAIDPHLDVEITGSAERWSATVLRRDQPAKEAGEVAVTRFSTGSTFTFEHRRSLPITPIQPAARHTAHVAITRGFFGKRSRPERPDRLPPGQYDTGSTWPTLTAEATPRLDPEQWEMKVDGLVDNPTTWSWRDLHALPGSTFFGDIHCVTTWSKFDVTFSGVSVDTLLEIAQPTSAAAFVMAHSTTGYTTNLPLADLTGGKAWIVWDYDGKPLDRGHGGPVRLLVPHLYFWKSAKWVTRLEVLDRDRPGFWEQNGYHDRGDPWLEQRYQGDP